MPARDGLALSWGSGSLLGVFRSGDRGRVSGGTIAMDESRPCGIGEIWGENRRGRLIELLKRDALRLGSFTLASGRSSHYYVDGRKVTLSAEGAA